MVSGHFKLAAMIGSVAIAAAAVAAPHASKPAVPKSAPDAQTQQLLQNCDAHKFETVVHSVVDGQPQQSKVKLCGKDGQSDADWIGTLKDAISKLNANKQMPASVRDQIIAALYAEIARLENPAPAAPAQSAGGTPALDSLSPLGGLPDSKPAQTASLPPPREVAPVALSDEYPVVPPLPTAPPPPTHLLGIAAGASLAPLPAPRISFTCFDAGEAEGPCGAFTRDTFVTVHAQEDLPAGTSLRFVRDGDPKADVALAQLRKGGSVRLALPTDVCLHAVGGKLELRIVRSGQEVASEGPYNLNC